MPKGKFAANWEMAKGKFAAKIYDGPFGSADPLHERRKICAAKQKFQRVGLHGTYARVQLLLFNIS